MKHGLFILLLLLISSNILAQKEVRDSIRSGNKAYQEQRYSTAESNYKSAIQLNAGAKEAIYNLANTYYKQSKFDEAIKEYQRYLTIENQNQKNMSMAWHNIANSCLKKKDLQNAMSGYKNALRLNPLDDQTRYNLAVVQKMIQDQKDKNKDKDKDKDKNKNKDKDKDKEQDKNQNKDKQDKQDKNKQEKKPEQNENEQMSQDNARQILQALEQDEKETQERVKQMKAYERKKQNENNKKQNKDW